MNSSNTGNALPSRPQIVDIKYEYDKRGNVLKRYDNRPGAQWAHRHTQLEYDELYRLKESKFGVESGGGSGMSSYSARSQKWTLDKLGNWASVETNPNSSGVYQNEEERNHNQANEVTARTPQGGSSLDLEFDHSGNIKRQEIAGSGSSTVAITYGHDGWNRLVWVKYDNVLRSEFQYNALHQRIMKTADVRGAFANTDTPPNGVIDQRRIMYYDASGGWRLLQEDIDDTFTGSNPTFSADRRMQYFWGLRGADDILLHRADAGADGSYEKHHYHLTDSQFSTQVILDSTAKEVERLSYNAYGGAQLHLLGDLDGDGFVTQTDKNLLEGELGNSGVVADLNRDGIVNSADVTLLNANLSRGYAPGPLTSANVDNQIGYAGYHFHRELHIYLARHRWFDPELGRFLQRDPAGYVDGMNLYLYGAGSPFTFVDPTGLAFEHVIRGWNDGQSGTWYHTYKKSGFLWQNTTHTGSRFVPDMLQSQGARLTPEEQAVNAHQGLNRVRADRFNQAADGVRTAAKVGEQVIRTVSAPTDVVASAAEFVQNPSVLTAAAVPLAVLPGKNPVHHIATNKNFKSTLRGGPWSPRFEALFKKAGMSMEDAFNKLSLPGHKNAAHPEAYHQAVYDRLTKATNGLEGEEIAKALKAELETLGAEIADPQSALNKLLTNCP